MNPNNPFGLNDHFKTVVLERMRFGVGMAVGAREQQRLRADQLEFMVEQRMTEMVYRLNAEIFGHNIPVPPHRYPANWKEACKQAFYDWLGSIREGDDTDYGHFPWVGYKLRQSWPVICNVVEFDARLLYPDVVAPDSQQYVKMVIQKGFDR